MVPYVQFGSEKTRSKMQGSNLSEAFEFTSTRHKKTQLDSLQQITYETC